MPVPMQPRSPSQRFDARPYAIGKRALRAQGKYRFHGNGARRREWGNCKGARRKTACSSEPPVACGKAGDQRRSYRRRKMHGPPVKQSNEGFTLRRPIHRCLTQPMFAKQRERLRQTQPRICALLRPGSIRSAIQAGECKEVGNNRTTDQAGVRPRDDRCRQPEQPGIYGRVVEVKGPIVMTDLSTGQRELAKAYGLLGHPMAQHLEKQGLQIRRLVAHPEHDREGVLLQQWMLQHRHEASRRSQYAFEVLARNDRISRKR